MPFAGLSEMPFPVLGRKNCGRDNLGVYGGLVASHRVP